MNSYKSDNKYEFFIHGTNIIKSFINISINVEFINMVINMVINIKIKK